MNMAILIIPMKLAWSKVSKKHLDFEICLSDTREPLSYPHIQMPKWRIFHGRYDLSDDFFFHQMRYFEAFGVTKTLNISNLKIQYFQKKFLSVRNCSKKKKKRKSQWLNQELNPGSHDWTESVQTTISYRNVIVFFCEKHLIYIKNHQMDMNFKVDSNQDFSL